MLRSLDSMLWQPMTAEEFYNNHSARAKIAQYLLVKLETLQTILADNKTSFAKKRSAKINSSNNLAQTIEALTQIICLSESFFGSTVEYREAKVQLAPHLRTLHQFIMNQVKQPSSFGATLMALDLVDFVRFVDLDDKVTAKLCKNLKRIILAKGNRYFKKLLTSPLFKFFEIQDHYFSNRSMMVDYNDTPVSGLQRVLNFMPQQVPKIKIQMPEVAWALQHYMFQSLYAYLQNLLRQRVQSLNDGHQDAHNFKQFVASLQLEHLLSQQQQNFHQSLTQLAEEQQGLDVSSLFELNSMFTWFIGFQRVVSGQNAHASEGDVMSRYVQGQLWKLRQQLEHIFDQAVQQTKALQIRFDSFIKNLQDQAAVVEKMDFYLDAAKNLRALYEAENNQIEQAQRFVAQIDHRARSVSMSDGPVNFRAEPYIKKLSNYLTAHFIGQKCCAVANLLKQKISTIIDHLEQKKQSLTRVRLAIMLSWCLAMGLGVAIVVIGVLMHFQYSSLHGTISLFQAAMLMPELQLAFAVMMLVLMIIVGRKALSHYDLKICHNQTKLDCLKSEQALLMLNPVNMRSDMDAEWLEKNSQGVTQTSHGFV